MSILHTLPTCLQVFNWTEIYTPQRRDYPDFQKKKLKFLRLKVKDMVIKITDILSLKILHFVQTAVSICLILLFVFTQVKFILGKKTGTYMCVEQLISPIKKRYINFNSGTRIYRKPKDNIAVNIDQTSMNNPKASGSTGGDIDSSKFLYMVVKWVY